MGVITARNSTGLVLGEKGAYPSVVGEVGLFNGNMFGRVDIGANNVSNDLLVLGNTPTVEVLGSNLTVNNDIVTFATGLVITPQIEWTYIKFMLRVSSSPVADMVLQIGNALGCYLILTGTAYDTSGAIQRLSMDNAQVKNFIIGGETTFVVLEGLCFGSALAFSTNVGISQNVAEISDTSILAGSYILTHRLLTDWDNILE